MSTGPLRIFLSYGHDASEELVRRIKADLEKRGHDVWFDKNKIKAGDDWRRSITDGILGSNRVMSFLSKHSTRDPGVCLDEIAIAIGVTHTRGDTVIAAQFCEWDKPDHRNAPRVVRSLAFQLATRLPDYRKLLLTLAEIAELDRKDAAELFDYLLANPLRSVINGGRERYLIVIDALDEAGGDGRNPLVVMLVRIAKHLPVPTGIEFSAGSKTSEKVEGFPLRPAANKALALRICWQTTANSLYYSHRQFVNNIMP